MLEIHAEFQRAAPRHVTVLSPPKGVAKRDIPVMGRLIPVEKVFAEWRKDPEYVAAYDAPRRSSGSLPALIQARRTRRLSRKSRSRGTWGTDAGVVARRLEAVTANHRRAPRALCEGDQQLVLRIIFVAARRRPTGIAGVFLRHFLAGARAPPSENLRQPFATTSSHF